MKITIKNSILIIFCCFGLAYHTQAQTDNRKTDDLPYKPLSEFGMDTIVYMGYNFRQRPPQSYEGMTVSELEALMPFSAIEIDRSRSIKLDQSLKFNTFVMSLHLAGVKITGQPAIQIHFKLKENVPEQDVLLLPYYWRSAIKDYVVEFAKIDEESFGCYFFYEVNKKRRIQLGIDHLDRDSLPFRSLEEFNFDTPSFFLYNFRDRNEKAYQGITVKEFFDLVPFPISRIYVSTAKDLTHGKKIRIYTKNIDELSYNLGRKERAVYSIDFTVEIEDEIPKAEPEGMSQEEINNHFIRLIGDKKILELSAHTPRYFQDLYFLDLYFLDLYLQSEIRNRQQP